MDFSKLDTFLSDMPHRGYPSCELAVSKDGKTVYRKSIGFSDAQGTRPASPNDIYWIFSATKVITCIAAMKLVDEGIIALNDPVSKYIPEYADLIVRAKDGSISMAQNKMTVEHLFTMTGGMNYNLSSPATLPLLQRGAGTLETVRAMAKNLLSFEPGTHYQYSLCHDVLGAVIEVASGMKLSEYFKKIFFEPLNISDMGFFPTDKQKARFAAMYRYSAELSQPVEIPVNNKFMLTPSYESGGAGLFSTVDEYMKIITVIACGGTTPDGYRILSPEAIKMMEQNRLPKNIIHEMTNGQTRLFGYGWGLCGRVHCDPLLSASLSPVGEFGWDGAANAYTLIDTQNRLAVYFGTHIHNCNIGPYIVHPQIRNLVYEALQA